MSDLHTLTIYGASDDLVEVEGYVNEEFDAWRSVALTIETPQGAKLDVIASFHHGWTLAIEHTDPAWIYPVRFGASPDKDENPAIHLEVPEGTTVTRPGGDR